MNKTKLLSLLAASSIGLTFLSVTTASADTIYGGYGYGYGYNSPSQEKMIAIDKQVKKPQTNDFVDQLTLTDPTYLADQKVEFRITIRNTGKTNFSTVTVKDIVPQYLTITDTSINGRPVTYDANTKTYQFTFDGLAAGEAKTYPVNGKVASSAQLPVNAGSFCLVNQATAAVDGVNASDNAQFCVTIPSNPTTKGGLPVYPAPVIKNTPSTGPEALVLFALAPLAGIGQLLRKKSI